MKASSSTNTTVQDLENAIRFLNKELSVRDIENIYGDFNDPTFQAALREVKGNLDDITRAVNLRSLVLLKNAYEKWEKMLINKWKNQAQFILEKEKELEQWDKVVNLLVNLDKGAWDKFTNEELLLIARFTQKYGNKLNYQKMRVEVLEKQQKELEKVGNQLVGVNKQIYFTQMNTLVNVMQNMFTMVLDNIIY